MPFHPHFTDFPWMRTDLRGARAPLRNLRGGWGRELSRNRHEGVLSAAPVLYLQILVCPKGAEAWETQRQNIELKYRQNNGIISLSKGTQANCNLAWLCMGLKFVSANHIGISKKKKKNRNPDHNWPVNWTLAIYIIICYVLYMKMMLVHYCQPDININIY